MHVQSIGGRELCNTDAYGFTPVVVEIRSVVFRSEFGTTDIAEANQGAIAVALQNDVVKLRGFGETANGADADLKLLAGKRGLGADLSGGHFDVLFRQRADDVG